MTTDPAARALIYDRVFCVLLAVMLPLAAALPRLTAFAPAAAGVILFTLAALYLKQPPRPSRAFLCWIAAFPLMAALSSLWAADPAEALGRAGKMIPILAGGAALAAVCSDAPPARDRRFLNLIPVFYALALAVLAAELYLEMPFYKLFHGIPLEGRALPDHANRGVVFCAITYTPVMALLWADRLRSWRPRAALAAFITIFIVLVLAKTASQTALLTVAVAVLFAALFPFRLKAAWLALGALLVCAFLAAPWLAQFLFQRFAEDIQHVPLLGKGKAFAANRLEIWDFVSRHALQNPLCGFGVEATRAIEFDSKEIYQPGRTILHPHNFALQIWIEFGLAGALPAAALLAWILRQIYKQGRPAARRAGLCAFMGAVAASSVSYGLWQSWWLGSLMLTAALTALAMKRLTDDGEA